MAFALPILLSPRSEVRESHRRAGCFAWRPHLPGRASGCSAKTVSRTQHGPHTECDCVYVMCSVTYFCRIVLNTRYLFPARPRRGRGPLARGAARRPAVPWARPPALRPPACGRAVLPGRVPGLGSPPRCAVRRPVPAGGAQNPGPVLVRPQWLANLTLRASRPSRDRRRGRCATLVLLTHLLLFRLLRLFPQLGERLEPLRTHASVQ